MARQAGYKIVVELFVPVDQKDIADTIAKAKAVQAAEKGNLSSVIDLPGAEVSSFKHSFTSRNTGTGRAGEEEDDAEGDDASDAPRARRTARAGAHRQQEAAAH